MRMAAGQNFRLSTRVQAGSVVIAVAGNGRRTGRYTLETYVLAGYLENPGAVSFQSGVGVLSGWVCTADLVEIALNGTVQEAAYGTERVDTADICGDTDNGFGLLFNWNLLGAGEHTVVATNPVRDEQGRNPPQFPEPTTTRSVQENAAAGSPVGAPVTATDADEADKDLLTYTLSDADAGPFALNPNTGQLTVAEGTELDYETKATPSR